MELTFCPSYSNILLPQCRNMYIIVIFQSNLESKVMLINCAAAASGAQIVENQKPEQKFFYKSWKIDLTSKSYTAKFVCSCNVEILTGASAQLHLHGCTEYVRRL